MIQLTCTLPDGSRYTTRTLDAKNRWSMFAGPQGAAFVGQPPQILGCHVVQWDMVNENVALLTLLVSNAACLPDGTGFPGRVYFDSIKLTMAGSNYAGMHELVRPRISGEYLVSKPASGQNVLDAGRALVFRLGLYKFGHDAEARAALDLQALSIPRIVSDYGPQRMKLPQVNRKKQAEKWKAKLERQRQCLESGKADQASYFWSPAFGPYHLPEDPKAYDYGGRRIQFVFGYGQCREEVLFERRLMDRFIERMVVHCFDTRTGERITSEDWAKGAGKPYQPFETDVGAGDEEQRDPYAANRAPHYPPALDPDRVFNQGSCPYEAQLREYDTIDAAHLIRALGSAQVAWWHAKDPLARMYLANLAHHVRQSGCDIGPPPDQWSRSLRAALQIAKGSPGQGYPSFGRGQGWVLTALACGHAVARSDAERSQFAGAMRMALDVHALAAMPSGLSQRAGQGGIAEAWDVGALKPSEDGCQSFEFPIAAHGLMCCLWQLGLISTERVPIPPPGSRPLVPHRNLAILMRGARDLYAQGIPPTKYRVVGVHGGAPLMSSKPAGQVHDRAHTANLVAELWRASSHPDFERMAREIAQGVGWKAILDSGTDQDFPEWHVSLVAMMQDA